MESDMKLMLVAHSQYAFIVQGDRLKISSVRWRRAYSIFYIINVVMSRKVIEINCFSAESGWRDAGGQ